MHRILYPENRLVSDAWVISQAHDRMVDDAVDAHVKANHGALIVDDETYERIARAVKQPDLMTAREYLDDTGLVTFAARDDR